AGRGVIQWPDNDEPGYAHMQRIAAELAELKATVRWLIWPEAPEHGDAADFFARGGTVDDLGTLVTEKLSARTPAVLAESKLIFRTAREIAADTPEQTEWIARPWLAKGSLTELDGKIKQAGKTTWTLSMVRKILDG